MVAIQGKIVITLSSWYSFALFNCSSLLKNTSQCSMLNSSIAILATSAISIGYSLNPVNGNGCAKKEWTACPPSCTMVIKSCICPAAFIKINGAPLSANGQLYPPGAFPILLSKSRCCNSFILARQSPKKGRSLEKHSIDRSINCFPVVNGWSGGVPAGSASISQGRSESRPSFSFFFW